jgi:catechol 2,3-dioxygenase-like lactoylglutathione lyase family enzyme
LPIIGVGMVHLCFHVDNVDAAMETLRLAGVLPFVEPFDLPEAGRRLAFVRDPAGTIVELAEDRRRHWFTEQS